MTRSQYMKITLPNGSINVPIFTFHTLILGSGAAGLNASIQLHNNGIKDIAIITEGLNKGTSINTGSDKQTYYKLSLLGNTADSPYSMAQTLCEGGGMHGDIALAEAANSLRAFFNLVNLGVPFPTDIYGQFAGYKTDHDPARRATSAGPYTSKFMCEALIKEIKRRNIEVKEKRVAITLLVIPESCGKIRAAGFIAIRQDAKKFETAFEVYLAENLIFAVGGPGGLYKASVYPSAHTGAIGLALMEGAYAYNLQESQFGLASLRPRWNVSGSYMQVIPRFISVDADGKSNVRDFLSHYFKSPHTMRSAIFLKGYQWPFDTRKIVNTDISEIQRHAKKYGSSLIDILVYIETIEKGRRVFLDFRNDSPDFKIEKLIPEAYEYLKNSGAVADSPIDRLEKMNPDAVRFYADHSVDLRKQPLEIAVCAQHNNGGLAANIWWESLNIKHLFPIGEVNGTHGIYRPGGSALNSGQVGGFRAAEFIADKYNNYSLDREIAISHAEKKLTNIIKLICKNNNSCGNSRTWKAERETFQRRMSEVGAHIRNPNIIDKALIKAEEQFKNLSLRFMKWENIPQLTECLRNMQLCFAHIVYLHTIKFFLQTGVGSRGSALVINEKEGLNIHSELPPQWKMQKENTSFRHKILLTKPENIEKIQGINITHEWIEAKQIPTTNTWFENVWKEYKKRRKEWINT